MKKVLFGVFAHPDDEAFGPSAYLHYQAQLGVDIHLVVATDGESGTNTDEVEDLGTVRLKEWEESRKRIGAKSGLALHYPDGGLCNNLYLEIAGKVSDFVNKTLATYQEDIEVDFVTFDHDGVTGHIDHIAMSFIATYVYLMLRKLAQPHVRVGQLKYYCLRKELIPEATTDWIYMPSGKSEGYYDEIFNFEKFEDQKINIMKAHHSQRKDMEEVILANYNHEPEACTNDCFRYYKDEVTLPMPLSNVYEVADARGLQ